MNAQNQFRHHDIPLSEVAKQLEIGRNTLFKRLREKHVLSDENYPFDQYQRKGLLKVKHKVWEDRANQAFRSYYVVMVSQKGIEFIKNTIAD